MSRARRAPVRPPPRAGAAAGTARNVVEIPRVAGGFEGRRPIGAAQRELVHRQFAQQDAARAFQPLGSRGVNVGNAVYVHLRTGRGADAGGVVQVFERERDAVHHAAKLAAQHLGLGDARLSEGAVFKYQDERVQVAVGRLYAIQTGAG